MKVIVAEDELMARKTLKGMLLEIDPTIEIVKEIESILDLSNALSWLKPDLLFLDIQLSDGICFELFEILKVDIPIIFTTFVLVFAFYLRIGYIACKKHNQVLSEETSQAKSQRKVIFCIIVLSKHIFYF